MRLFLSPCTLSIDPDTRDENFNHLAFALEFVIALNVVQAVTEPC
jgi:uncharacterized membrane protein